MLITPQLLNKKRLKKHMVNDKQTNYDIGLSMLIRQVNKARRSAYHSTVKIKCIKIVDNPFINEDNLCAFVFENIIPVMTLVMKYIRLDEPWR